MAVTKPPVVKRHPPLINGQPVNCWTGIRDKQRAVVLHITAGGSLAGVDSWFDNPASQTRVCYCIGPTGEIHEYFDPDSDLAGFAHGKVEGYPEDTSPYFNALYQAAGGRNPNWWAKVGIEHIGHNLIEEFAKYPAMFEASTWLTAWACDHFGFPGTTEHILGHQEITAYNRVSCPSPKGPAAEAMWERYLARVQQRLAGTTPQPPAPQPEELVSKTTVSQLWAAYSKLAYVQGWRNETMAGRRANSPVADAVCTLDELFTKAGVRP